MSTLRARLQLALGVSLFVFSLLLWFAGNRILEALASDLVATGLEEEAESLLAALEFAPDGRGTLRDIAPSYRRPFSGHYFVLRAANQELTSRSLWDQTLTLPPLAHGAVDLRRVRGPQAQRLLLRTASYEKDARSLTIAVAADLGPVETYRHRLGFAVLLFAVGAALALGITQHVVLRASLQPLTRIRVALRALERGEAEHLAEDVPGEVLPLVQEVNRLLTTLSRRLARSRHALGDLAHALKTPLQLLADDLARDPVTRDAGKDARAQAEQIRMLIERELKRARLAGSSVPAERFELPGDLADLCATMRQLHRDRDLDIDFLITGDVPPFAEREDMQELLGNLLDNACKWAARRVRVVVTAGDPLIIAVSDDGPGINPAAREAAMARGTRLDEFREGYGLGLAIAGDVVEAYGGELALRRDQTLGGLAAVVTLPQANFAGAERNQGSTAEAGFMALFSKIPKG